MTDHFWWFWRIVIICIMWPYSLYSDHYIFLYMRQFNEQVHNTLSIVHGPWTWLWFSVMDLDLLLLYSVITLWWWVWWLILSGFFHLSPPHQPAVDQVMTSLGLLPFTHIGKLTLNTSHPYHLPCLSENLTRWMPEKTIFLSFFLLWAQLHSFFFTLSSPSHTVL